LRIRLEPKRVAHLIVLAVMASVPRIGAQSPPPLRPLGPILSTSVEPLGAVSQVRALADGHVIVHDNAGRRVLLFDSTLTSFTVIADSTSQTGNAYGSQIGGLVAARGDTTYFVDPVAYSMFVIDPRGRIVRVLAVPRPGDVNHLIGGPFGTPGVDARGRLVYMAAIPAAAPPGPGHPHAEPDSALVVRFDFTSRSLETVAKIGIPRVRYAPTSFESLGISLVANVAVVNTMPWTDDWALLADGTIAVVRGQEYRVEFIDTSGKISVGAKLPFDWHRMTDEEKTAQSDSTRREAQRQRAASIARGRAQRGVVTNSDSTPRAASSGSKRPQAPSGSAPTSLLLQFAAIDEMPDYRPAFRQGAAIGDRDGYLWIRTSKMMNGGAIYDVISRNGELIDRIQVPPGRTIAGFGPGGGVYMGVVDGDITRLERARTIVAGK